MTSLPVVGAAHAQSSLSLLCPDAYCDEAAGGRQAVVVVAAPLRPGDDAAAAAGAAGAVAEGPRDAAAEDLTTRVSELLQTTDDTRHDSSSAAAATRLPRNPEFGTSKSPKSYWLRRHSDSVFAGDELASPAERCGKERTVSDSRSAINQLDYSTLRCLLCNYNNNNDVCQHWQSVPLRSNRG